jgi:hypothetical protein
MVFNFQRPNLPYEAQSLKNSNRYQLLTRSGNRPPTDIMLDTDFDYIIDGMRKLDAAIVGVGAGILPGANDLNNKFKVPVTDGANHIGWTQITDAYIAPNSITNLSIMPQTITANEIQNSTITGIQISIGTILGSNIGLETITGGAGGNISLQSVTGGQFGNIKQQTITSWNIYPGSLTGNLFENQTIDGIKIINYTLTGVELADNSIGSRHIKINNITTDKIADLAVTALKIANDTITFTQINSSFTATKSQQQAGDSSSVYVSPARQQDHPSAASFWCYFDGRTTGTNAPLAGYNVTSIQRISTGKYQINYTSGFSTANYGVFPSAGGDNSNTNAYILEPLNANSCKIQCGDPFGGDARDPAVVCVFGFGTLA